MKKLLLCFIFTCGFLYAGGRWDLNGDGRDDVLIQQNHLLRLLTFASGGEFVDSSRDLGGNKHRLRTVRGIADFDGDGKKDILFYDEIAQVPGFWPIGRSDYKHETDMGAYDTTFNVVSSQTWELMGGGDLNGDGYGDFVWRRHDTGTIAYWLLGPSGGRMVKIKSGSLAAAHKNNYEFLGIGDIDGNGSDDFLFHNKSNGNVVYWAMHFDGLNADFTSGTIGNRNYNTYRVVGLGDLNNDQKVDVMFQNKDTGSPSFWCLTGNPQNGVQILREGSWASIININDHRIVDIRDTNGDGRGDLIYQSRKRGEIRVSLHNGFQSNGNISAMRSQPVSLGSLAAMNVLGQEDHMAEWAVVTRDPGYQTHPDIEVLPATNDMVSLIARHHGDGYAEGIYDPYSQRTFVVYPGGDTDPDGFSYSYPMLIIYDHFEGRWSDPYQLPVAPIMHNGSELQDAHTYPQIFSVGGTRILQVVYSGHVHDLKRIRAKVTFDDALTELFNDANWEEVGFQDAAGNDLDHMDKSTYVRTFTRIGNRPYVIWRQSYIQNDPTGDARLGANPCEVNNYDIYEPWYYTFSNDYGNTWEQPRVMFNPQDGDTWDTIYLNSMKYHGDKLHTTFSLSQYHNCYGKGLYYGYFKFDNNGFLVGYAPGDRHLGSTIDQVEAENPVNKMLVHDQGRQAPRPGSPILGFDHQDRTHIFHTVYDGSAYGTIRHIWLNSDGTWSNPVLLRPNRKSNVWPHHVVFDDDSQSYNLYVTWFHHIQSVTQRWKFNHFGTINPNQTQNIFGMRDDPNRIWEMIPIMNLPGNQPRFLLKFGSWTGWEKPKGNGELIMWSQADGFQ